MSVANNLLDAIDILAEDKVAAVKFDKTVRATIDEVVDASIGKYKVKYQNSIFFAYALDLKTYSKGVQVYVVIPSSDFNKDPYITGTVRKSATTATDVITQADRMTMVGTNVITMSSNIGFCSYKTNDPATKTKDLAELVTIDSEGLSLYKKDSDYIQIGATFQTKLSNQQRVGAGNYGIRVYCSYYNSKYTDEAKTSEVTIPRIYELNVNNMVGNPYSFGVPSEQSVLFEIDSVNLRSIDKVEAFCENFPYSNAGTSDTYTGYLNPADYQFYKNADFTNRINFGNKDSYIYDKRTKEWYAYNTETKCYDINKTDIILSNIFFEFYDALTEDELNGLSLRITTPYGNYFYKDKTTGKTQPESLTLHGSLRVKGKSVNYKEQDVHFYWFIKDNSVTANSPGYSKYGGTGWRCLNPTYNSSSASGAGTSYSPDTYDKQISADLCTAKETEFKCVAVFKDGTDTVSADNTIKLYNKTNTTNPEVTLTSTMGADFSFNEGKTSIVCYIGGKTKDSGFNPSPYSFYWTKSVDAGNAQPVLPDANNAMKLSNVDVADSYKFVTYECTVKKKSGNTEIDFGSAAITLTNGEPSGQYSLVIKNGTQVFQYTKEGVSPTSPTLDEYERMVLPQLEFDIYNDKGQLLSFGSNEEKIKRMNIRWIWPGTKNPTNLAENETMLKPSDKVTFKTYDFTDPTNNSTHRKYVVTQQATLPYGLLETYDLSKYDNNIVLEIDYNNQHLSAITNFTFTKDGEAGTNGSKYLTRIVPKNSNYSKVVLFHNNSGYKLYGFKPSTKSFEVINSWTALKAQVWDGHGNNAYLDSDTSGSSKVSCIWSTLAQDRNLNRAVKVTNASNGTIAVSGNSGISTTVIKVALTDKAANKIYYATYPLEYYTNLGFYVDGGYRNCSYQSDGTRSTYNQQPFTLRAVGTGVPVVATWATHGWIGKIVNANNDSKYKLIDPPPTYDGEKIENYITAIYNGVTYSVPIELYLDRYGLSAVADWDGNSIKLNTTGSNYILSPQIGAGTNDNNGFTGVTMGKAMENGKNSIGLFGYHHGQRSIFLDSETGNAEFGKAGSGKIIIGPQQRGVAPLGAIYSDSFYNNNPTTGYPASEAGKGMLIDLVTPSIRFGSGHFSVDSSGNLTAKGSGTIAGWKISDYVLTSNNNAVTLTSNATGSNAVFNTPGFRVNADGSFSAANTNFTVTSDGTIMAKKGTIGGWNISGTQLSSNNGAVYLDSSASSNTVMFKAGSNFSVQADGTITAKDGTIGGWTITADRLESADKSIFLQPRNQSTEASKIVFKANNFYVRADGGFKTGDKDWDEAIFRVTKDGKLKATAGTIGGWTIGTNSLKADELTLNSDGSLQGPTWSITKEGLATFSNIRITNTKASGADDTTEILNIAKGDKHIIARNDGTLDVNKIIAKGGTIGGFTLGKDTIFHGNLKLDASGEKLTTGTITVDNENGATGKLNSRGGSNIGAGHVYAGGSGSGGASADWDTIPAWDLTFPATAHKYVYDVELKTEPFTFLDGNKETRTFALPVRLTLYCGDEGKVITKHMTRNFNALCNELKS